MRKDRIQKIGYFVLAIFLQPFEVNAKEWPVELTSDQNAALIETVGKPQFSALAVAPQGEWGNSWNYSSVEEADIAALNNCQEYLSKGDFNCAIVARNGIVIKEKVVESARVTEVYKPIHGKKAASFFLGGAISFFKVIGKKQ